MLRLNNKFKLWIQQNIAGTSALGSWKEGVKDYIRYAEKLQAQLEDLRQREATAAPWREARARDAGDSGAISTTGEGAVTIGIPGVFDHRPQTA